MTATSVRLVCTICGFAVQENLHLKAFGDVYLLSVIPGAVYSLGLVAMFCPTYLSCF